MDFHTISVQRIQLTSTTECPHCPLSSDKSRVVVSGDKPLTSFGLASGDEVIFKDLGPQISWRTVFLIEYVGPILVHLALYCLPALFYPQHRFKGHTYTQQVALACVLFHYVKRELETLYVHVFSLDTMPVRNIFKNSFHYWVLGGALIAYFLYHPLYTEHFSHAFVTACAALFVAAELGNLYCHLILRWLRPAGSKVRGIPRGFLFEYVTCANYTCELAAWLVFCVFTSTLTSWLFLVVSAAQIAQWSVKKHVAQRKEFGDKVPRRKILVPFVW